MICEETINKLFKLKLWSSIFNTYIQDCDWTCFIAQTKNWVIMNCTLERPSKLSKNNRIELIISNINWFSEKMKLFWNKIVGWDSKSINGRIGRNSFIFVDFDFYKENISKFPARPKQKNVETSNGNIAGNGRAKVWQGI